MCVCIRDGVGRYHYTPILAQTTFFPFAGIWMATLGAVLSRLTVIEAVALLPALSRAVPVATAPRPSAKRRPQTPGSSTGSPGVSTKGLRINMLELVAHGEPVYPEPTEGNHGRSPFDKLRMIGSCPVNLTRLFVRRLYDTQWCSRVSIGARRELAGLFPEYTTFNYQPCFEEMSNDGRYIALMGVKTDQTQEIFSYDVTARTKGQVLAIPQASVDSVDWVGMSASGRYVLIVWGFNGSSRHVGLEAFDRTTMAYAGKVTTTCGHGDRMVDANGNEFYIYTNASNDDFLDDKHYIVKSRIPNGELAARAAESRSGRCCIKNGKPRSDIV